MRPCPRAAPVGSGASCGRCPGWRGGGAPLGEARRGPRGGGLCRAERGCAGRGAGPPSVGAERSPGSAPRPPAEGLSPGYGHRERAGLFVAACAALPLESAVWR